MAEPTVAKPNNLHRLFPNEASRAIFNDNSPNVLLCGLPRAGKTSIAKVVFAKASPHESLYCTSTTVPEISKIENTRISNFCLVDLPGSLLLDPQFDQSLFSNASALVFVIDAQAEPHSAEIAHSRALFKRACQVNPGLHLEVFIHKVDGDFFVVDDVRSACQRDIHDKLMSHLHEDGVVADLVFYSTSIYDHTIFEAFSRVVQRLMPETHTLEELLDLLVANCRMEKAFLIDILSRTFIATDTSPFDAYNFELCTDMVELVIEISCIYGLQDGDGKGTSSLPTSGAAPSAASTAVAAAAGGDAATSTFGLIQMTNGTALFLREVDRLVALACVLRAENFDKPQLVDYNIRILRDAMMTLFAEKPELLAARRAAAAKSRDGG